MRILNSDGILRSMANPVGRQPLCFNYVILTLATVNSLAVAHSIGPMTLANEAAHTLFCGSILQFAASICAQIIILSAHRESGDS